MVCEQQSMMWVVCMCVWYECARACVWLWCMMGMGGCACVCERWSMTWAVCVHDSEWPLWIPWFFFLFHLCSHTTYAPASHHTLQPHTDHTRHIIGHHSHTIHTCTHTHSISYATTPHLPRAHTPHHIPQHTLACTPAHLHT